MAHRVQLAITLVSLECILYIVSLLAPGWLVHDDGISQGLFLLCSTVDRFTVCFSTPAWLGPGSLSWMCLTASVSLTFLSLFTIKSAILEGRRPIIAVILSTLAVLCCAGAMAAFLTTLTLQSHALLKDLGWTFYTCCCSLAFGFTVTLFIGMQKKTSSIVPTATITSEEFPMPTTVALSDPTQAV